MAQFEEDAAMVGGGEMKTGKAAIAERKKKRREGQVKKDKHANSIVIACLKRLLPVGLNVFGGRELDIVQQSKERFLQREPEDKIREFIKGLLEIPIKTDPTDKNAWQLSLYRKIGKSQMRGKNEMTQDAVIEKIFNMGQVSAILHTIMRMKDRRKLRTGLKTEHPQQQLSQAWKKVVSTQRKRAVVACFRMVPLYGIPRHRGINFFLPAFSRLWLEEEDVGQDKLISDLVSGVEEDESPQYELVTEDGVIITEENRESETHPDPLKQLIRCFQRAATSEEGQAALIVDDNLYIRFADVMSKSIHIEEEDGDDGDDEIDQAMLIEYLQLKKDVRFFTSMAGLMNKCSVLNLEMFERQIKAEGLGMGAELAAGGNQNLND
ncbi:unnamed protein product, partial [Nippostrongylus brasiliensis]|uniref:Ryanodine receptor 44F (inferred by orthology to a D. melanogaster protein) n=1 Tax=Nippostrongylus brasiliensis TaxID=27835 RepID=A0A0N4YRE6_NIPBR